MGISYAGAFEVLEGLGILQQIRYVAGTSAGSMAGLMLALGYSRTEIRQKIRESDFARFLDHGNVNQIVRQYGYYGGDYATQVFHDWIEGKLGSAEATFEDLIEANGLDLQERGRLIACLLRTVLRIVSEYGAIHPPYAKPPLLSSSGPPGAWMTPSKEICSSTITFLTIESILFLCSTKQFHEASQHLTSRAKSSPFSCPSPTHPPIYPNT